MQYHGVGRHHDQWPTRLHVVANGTMTGQRYIGEVLLPHVRLFRGAVDDKFVFMDDNATCHRTLAVQDCLDSEGIQRLVWPACSPDLNPIENVWDALGRKVAGRNYPPTNKNTLIRDSQRNGINCLNSCWMMLCKVWYDVWNVASHSTVDYPVLISFFKVPADFQMHCSISPYADQMNIFFQMFHSFCTFQNNKYSLF
ncbi:transposable element Tc1 transposase [Trichonephila clavipes]|nr:transposable element Tc1 transposase [Trichonephila clavipes]